MSPVAALIFLLFFYLLPLAHVMASPRSGAWSPPPGSRCPLGPRVGWMIIVAVAGALGWLLYLRGRRGRA